MSGINVNVVDMGQMDFDLDFDDIPVTSEPPKATQELRESLANLQKEAKRPTTTQVIHDDIPPRFVILDMNHLIHRYEYGMQRELTAMVEVEPAHIGYRLTQLDGTVVDVSEKEFNKKYGQGTAVFTHKEVTLEDGVRALKVIYQPSKRKRLGTKIPYGILNSIARWSRYGKDRIIVFSDLGGLKSRKSLFSEMYPELVEDTSKGRSRGGYKASRSGLAPHLREPLEHMTRVLNEAGIYQYRKPDYEADDFIKATIDRLKADEPGTAIDVVTNDADLLPLVDEQVSVFLSTKNATYPERGPLSKRNYTMVTPENYQATCEALSVYKNSKIQVPYNMLLLIKMLRGDKSDEIPQVPKMTPTRVRQITDALQETLPNQVLENLYRYGQDPYKIYQSLVPVMLDNNIFPLLQELQLEEVSKVYNTKVVSGEIDLSKPESSFTPGELGVGIPCIYDELWNVKEELLPRVTELMLGRGKDELGGVLELSKAMKNFTLMDLNNSLNNKRVPLEMKATPAPYSMDTFERSASRIFDIHLRR